MWLGIQFFHLKDKIFTPPKTVPKWNILITHQINAWCLTQPHNIIFMSASNQPMEMKYVCFIFLDHDEW